MKNILLSALMFASMLSCQVDKDTRYTRNCAEIDLLKNGIEHYENGDWDKWSKQYADSAKIYQNTWFIWSSPEVARDKHKALISKLSDYGFERENLSMERIIDDRGRTWVNSWALWRGTLKANNKVIEIPVHLTIQFVDGRIVEEWGFWDTSTLNEELRSLGQTAYISN